MAPPIQTKIGYEVTNNDAAVDQTWKPQESSPDKIFFMGATATTAFTSEYDNEAHTLNVKDAKGNVVGSIALSARPEAVKVGDLDGDGYYDAQFISNGQAVAQFTAFTSQNQTWTGLAKSYGARLMGDTPASKASKASEAYLATWSELTGVTGAIDDTVLTQAIHSPPDTKWVKNDDGKYEKANNQNSVRYNDYGRRYNLPTVTSEQLINAAFKQRIKDAQAIGAQGVSSTPTTLADAYLEIVRDFSPSRNLELPREFRDYKEVEHPFNNVWEIVDQLKTMGADTQYQEALKMMAEKGGLKDRVMAYQGMDSTSTLAQTTLADIITRLNDDKWLTIAKDPVAIGDLLVFSGQRAFGVECYKKIISSDKMDPETKLRAAIAWSKMPDGGDQALTLFNQNFNPTALAKLGDEEKKSFTTALDGLYDSRATLSTQSKTALFCALIKIQASGVEVDYSLRHNDPFKLMPVELGEHDKKELSDLLEARIDTLFSAEPSRSRRYSSDWVDEGNSAQAFALIDTLAGIGFHEEALALVNVHLGNFKYVSGSTIFNKIDSLKHFSPEDKAKIAMEFYAQQSGKGHPESEGFPEYLKGLGQAQAGDALTYLTDPAQFKRLTPERQKAAVQYAATIEHSDHNFATAASLIEMGETQEGIALAEKTVDRLQGQDRLSRNASSDLTSLVQSSTLSDEQRAYLIASTSHLFPEGDLMQYLGGTTEDQAQAYLRTIHRDGVNAKTWLTSVMALGHLAGHADEARQFLRARLAEPSIPAEEKAAIQARLTALESQ